MKRTRAVLIVVLLVAAAAAAWWRFGTRRVPEGQPPLVTLDASSLGALKADFNRAAGATRVILLLSPT